MLKKMSCHTASAIGVSLLVLSAALLAWAASLVFASLT